MQNPTHFIEITNPSWNERNNVCRNGNVCPIDILERSLALTQRTNAFFDNNGSSVTVAVWKIKMK